MKKTNMNRRQFLRSSGGAVASAAVVATGTATLVSPDTGRAATLDTLDQHQADTLLQVARQMFPHQSMADTYYMALIKDLDAEAAGDAATATLLADGVKALDSAMGVKWTDLSNGNQFKTLASMESSEFFQKVRGKAVVSLYNNDLSWRHFGYEGPAFDKGGYVNRGFNDLSWLPEPPEDASPKAG